MTLTIEHINHSFGGNRILHDCSYQFKSGEVYVIIGANGIGKSTLINIVNGYIKPSSGKIILDNVNNITFNTVEKNNSLGILRLWQFGEIFKNTSVMDNLRVVSKQLGENLLNYLLCYKRIIYQEKKLTDTAEKILSLFGLKEKSNELAGSLSIGQQKLLAFGRILMDGRVNDGKAIILLDEPFSGISSINIEIISKLIRQFASKGNIVIVVEHNIQRINEIATKKLEFKNQKINDFKE